MHLKKRLIAVAAVAVLAAVVLCVSFFGFGRTEEAETPFVWQSQKETIYFWYSDDTLTNYINSTAVAFG